MEVLNWLAPCMVCNPAVGPSSLVQCINKPRVPSKQLDYYAQPKHAVELKQLIASPTQPRALTIYRVLLAPALPLHPTLPATYNLLPPKPQALNPTPSFGF